MYAEKAFFPQEMSDTSLVEKKTDHPETNQDSFTLALNHILTGEIRRGKSIGIHYFVPAHHRVTEMIHSPNKKGVWEARIEIRNNKTQAWVQKKLASTFFPTEWSFELLRAKFHEAFINRKKRTSYKYIGKTSCGINIVFIYRDRKLVCCYPLYESTSDSSD